MAIAAPVLCVVGNEGEGEQFKNALAALNISNPILCMVGSNAAIAELDRSTREKEGGPILVFLSLAAPEANRLAAWFEAHPKDSPSALIATTGFKDMRPIIQAYHLGVTSFLEWPLKTEDIRNALSTNGRLTLELVDGKTAIRAVSI